MNTNEITKKIIEAAITVHRRLGPGLLESVYETVLAYELRRAGLACECQRQIAITYDDLRIPNAFRIDLLVNSEVLIELKSVEALEKVHFKQAVTYLRLADLRVGLLINFNVPLLRDGLHRLVNGYSGPDLDPASLTS